ncbi:SixA phosphatase family protein [Paludibacterium yongneupense]|uniref:SixA phosphatase family protein n=1 Tax=Paludibacterium yongneupense TaxID=400061 RepID=UPI001FEB7686|nr:histidine phosphatase family protein [Paludibacterium yongneupense]
MMDLILWRHAEAEEASSDMGRALTRRGQLQASQMAAWLRDRLPRDFTLIASEAVRARQTAACLVKSFEVCPEINPGAEPAAVLQAVGWPQRGKTVVLVGHQPYLGSLVSELLCGSAQDWSFKKGAIWWISHRERHGIEQIRLKAMLAPGLLTGEE